MTNTTKPTIRTRFAPSPTGFVHIGSLRTALFSSLFAKHNGGKHVLRIEDTDQNRFVEGSMENLLNIMKIEGIDFDEGPYMEDGKVKQKGEFGPYIQSQRKEQGIYQKHADELIASGKAYYCFCTEQRLEDLRKEQAALKKPPMYDRHCYNLPAEEKAKLLAESKASGKNPVIRFLIPEGQTIVHDLVYGDITYEHKVLDDQVILKSDGFPTYHLAVVVDDHHMQISHVIRGDEWIPSTPKHILIYQAFGWEPTAFAHLPLILNPDKSKLSKRQNDVAIEDYLKKGYLPEVLVNFVAFLGWNPKTEQEIFSLEELVEQFDISKINKSGAVFDLNKLDWISSQYIRKIPAAELEQKLIPYWQADPTIGNSGTFLTAVKNVPHDYLTLVASLEQERLKKLSEIGENTKYFFTTPQYDAGILVWKKSTEEDAKEKLLALHKLLSGFQGEQFSKENLETNIKGFISDNKFDNGSVLWPLRTALTGQEKSPGPFEVCAALAMGLGKEEVLKRLETAISKLVAL